jgi:Mg2+-importing ATPase
MTAFIFLINAILGKGVFPSFLFAIALAVGITPEVLPIIMTISLSNGALKMAKEKVITKRLASVEDFGNIDTLCCDKTGTLTEGTLSLAGYTTVDGKKDTKLILYGMVCSAVTGKKGKRTFGNPLDSALWQSKEASALESDVETLYITDKNEFDFERRRMGVLVRKDKDKIIIVKGAPESVIEGCTSVRQGDTVIELPEMISKINDQISGYEEEGFRVIAVAEKHTEKDRIIVADEKELTLMGFLLFLDPPKKTAKNSLKMLQKLGVAVKVISGDSPVITKRICHEVGLSITERVITGNELESLSESELEEYSEHYNVFARVTPEQKFKIVESLNKEGHIVGFLGDGINDAPALRAADVGISVDTATGIAKETADIILLDKSLRVLAHGIIEGRRTFGNITKYILNTTSANYGNMFTVAASSLFLGFIPLLPSQILLNNFVSDFPLLAISTDNVDEELLRRPRRWNIRFIRNFMIYFGAMSSFFDLVLIFSLIYLIKVAPELFRTSWFVLSALSEIVVTFAIRTKLPVLKSKPSVWLVVGSVLAGAGAVVIVYSAVGALLFEFVRMPVSLLGLIAGILAAYFVTAETVKKYFFRKFEI